MEKVKFKWISRAKYNALTIKRSDTIYFIYNEHVLYKGDQEYGGIQNITYTVNSDGDYIITITNGDGSQSILSVASSARLTQMLNALEAHEATVADDETLGHVYLTDAIDGESPQDVNDGTAVTSKAVVDYVANYQGKSFLQYESYLLFPSVGKEEVLYLALDTGYLYIYKTTTGGYELISDNWRRITEIIGTIE